MSRHSRNKLLVEGEQDKRVFPFLLDAHIVWGNSEVDWPVDIVAYNGVDDLLEDGEIQTQLKTPEIEALGIVVDANDSLESRWQAIRGRCLAAFPSLVEDLPQEGLITVNDSGLRLGIWIMPDNRTVGMLETFLSCLVPSDSEGVWTLTSQFIDNARDHGAPFKDVHRDKAKIHSWLAVQDPPGESLHLAVLQRILNPTASESDAFVNWFIDLYALDRR